MQASEGKDKVLTELEFDLDKHFREGVLLSIPGIGSNKLNHKYVKHVLLYTVDKLKRPVTILQERPTVPDTEYLELISGKLGLYKTKDGKDPECLIAYGN